MTVGRMKEVGGGLIVALGLERLLVSGGNPRGGKCSISGGASEGDDLRQVEVPASACLTRRYRGVSAALEHLPRRTSGPPDAARNILHCSLFPLSEYSPTGQRLIIRHDCPLENGESRAPRLLNNEVSLLEPISYSN